MNKAGTLFYEIMTKDQKDDCEKTVCISQTVFYV